MGWPRRGETHAIREKKSENQGFRSSELVEPVQAHDDAMEPQHLRPPTNTPSSYNAVKVCLLLRATEPNRGGFLWRGFSRSG